MQVTSAGIKFSNFSEFKKFLLYLGISAHQLDETQYSLVLAADIHNSKGSMLVRSGMPIGSRLFTRLQELTANSAAQSPALEIQKTKELILLLTKHLLTAIQSQMNSPSFLEKIGKTAFAKHQNDILEITKRVCANSKLVAFIVENDFTLNQDDSGGSGSSQTLLHAFRRSLIASGLLLRVVETPSAEVSSALFNMALVSDFAIADRLSKVDGKEKNQATILDEISRKLQTYQQNLDISTDVVEAIKNVAMSKFDEFAFVKQTDTPATLAKIYTIAETFLLMIFGQRGKELERRQALDALYLMSKKGMVSLEYIEQLALWMNEKPLFQFYAALERLEKSCDRGNAVPYPMRGFGSPVVVICAKNDYSCPHLARTLEQINIVNTTQKLHPGQYCKCKWLTAELQQFYDEFYNNIKAESRTIAAH